MKIDLNEFAQFVVIPVEEVFEGVNIPVNHLLYNVEFFVCYFLSQAKSLSELYQDYNKSMLKILNIALV